jgi:hypothetical protein
MQTLKQYPSVSLHDLTMKNTGQFVALQTPKFQPNDNFVTLIFQKCWNQWGHIGAKLLACNTT